MLLMADLAWLTIVSHGLPKWWANTEDNAREDVLEARYQEQGCIFRVLDT